MTDTVFGLAGPQEEGGGFNELQFMIQQWVMNNINTIKLVEVKACSNNSDVSRVGTVDVQPLVNQMTGSRNPVAHGKLSKLPYFRLQGGANAVILDPVDGDIGVACFCDRDISALKNALLAGMTGPQNPGSFGAFDWADGLYLGGFLNAVPTQYVRFFSGGIAVVSPGTVTVQAPTVTVNASSSAIVTSPAITLGPATKIDGVQFLPHTHLSTTPGDPTGPVIV
jgi:hypothetical protein